MKNTELKPMKFTSYEGGNWLPWPDYSITEKELERLLSSISRSTDKNTVVIHGIYVHSLFFETGLRWDVRNGWNLRSDKFVPY